MEYQERKDPLSWLNWAFRAGSISGVGVFIHWTFPFFLVSFALIEGSNHGAEWGWKVALTFVGLFAIVLFHEFGHVFAGRREGIEAERVTLSPLGGLATLGEEMEGGAEIRIAAAGPAVNVAFLLILLPIFALAGIRIGIDYLNPFWFWPTPAANGVPTFAQELIYLIHKANLIVTLFNLIPAFPMDGGRILRGVLHRRMGQIRSTITVTTIALFVAAGMLIWAVLDEKLILAFIAVSVGLTAWMTRKRALAFAAQYAHADMFDESGAIAKSIRESQKLAKEEEKAQEARAKEIEEEREIEARVDGLLAKISDTGLDSLTRKERAFLEKASRRKQ